MAHMFPANLHPALRIPSQITSHFTGEQFQSSAQYISQQNETTATGNSSKYDRLLPSREVTDENIDDAFVAFIIYCNPSVPADTDSTELRKIFRAPPKSDGKNFSTFTLFELIKKLDTKEIKTWAQLVEEMGVEKPSLEKKQSSQKVQQYAVRLKRWMHAMHVDAFFEYLNGKMHIYWTQIPAINDSASTQERDGVSAEEDLALRALLPETRPKRGRRKAEDREEQDMGKSPSQRPRLESPGLSEEFMLARSALSLDGDGLAASHPDYHHLFSDRMISWSNTEARSAVSTTFRWPPENSQAPMSAYPQSAITPSLNRTGLWNDVDEPRSAITPKSSRLRRKHGPAVSSAWPSGGGASAGKVRGRPPSNRSIQDGPFSTFPMNPAAKDGSTHRLSGNTPAATPTVSNSNVPQFFPPHNGSSQLALPQRQNPRPSRLSLQVPEHQGGAVRLATPPPVVLVNGQNSPDLPEDNMSLDASSSMPIIDYLYSPNMEDSHIRNRVSITSRQKEDTARANVDALESHIICEILAADWYDTMGNNSEKCTIDEAGKICKHVIKNLQIESSSKETLLINLSALAGGPLMTRLKIIKVDQRSISHYECCWQMRFGSIESDLTIRATIQHGAEAEILEAEPEESEESWKQKYLDLKQEVRLRDEKFGKLKRGMVNALIHPNKFSGAG